MMSRACTCVHWTFFRMGLCEFRPDQRLGLSEAIRWSQSSREYILDRTEDLAVEHSEQDSEYDSSDHKIDDPFSHGYLQLRFTTYLCLEYHAFAILSRAHFLLFRNHPGSNIVTCHPGNKRGE